MHAFTYFIFSGQFVQMQNGYRTLQVCHCNYAEMLIVLCMQQFDEKMYRCIHIHIYTNSIIKLARDKWIDCLNSHVHVHKIQNTMGIQCDCCWVSLFAYGPQNAIHLRTVAATPFVRTAMIPAGTYGHI